MQIKEEGRFALPGVGVEVAASRDPLGDSLEDPFVRVPGWFEKRWQA
jgi:hypothetical protein